MSEVVEKARAYYDSSDADEFYYRIWGGEDIHVGMYSANQTDIFSASQRTVESMAEKVAGALAAESHVLDIGSGYGGSARYLAKRFRCMVSCLNLSRVQNERNRKRNSEIGLNQLIEVMDGNFEEIPFEANQFDLVWSQDAILHSGQRQRVFEEVNRVLKPGGLFIFTDPMQKYGVDTEALKPVLDRIHLASLGSVDDYKAYSQDLGWTVVELEEHPEQLVNHYSAVLRDLESRDEELKKNVSTEYIENMKKGLQHWIHAGHLGLLNWGILVFKKPMA